MEALTTLLVANRGEIAARIIKTAKYVRAVPFDWKGHPRFLTILTES